MFPSNFRIKILAIRALFCALGSEGLKICSYLCELIALNVLRCGSLSALTGQPLDGCAGSQRGFYLVLFEHIWERMG